MDSQKPNEYVNALKQTGAEDASIIAIMRNAGWPEKDTISALASYYEAKTGLTIPSRQRSSGGPREAFLHLLSFITLGTWCISAGMLWFILIEVWLPDPAARVAFGNPLDGMSRGLASVLVAFPVFMLVMRGVWRELLNQPAQADSSIRRWLTYLALLAAAGTLIGDLVAFVQFLLSGEITERFLAKVLVVLVLAGGVFWFYLRSLQPAGEGRAASLRRIGQTGALAAAVLVALTLGLSFAKFGSPATQRLAAADERRSEDLEAIARVIRNRWIAARGQETPTLPDSLGSLPERAALRLSDPVTGDTYRYRPLGGGRYELCAAFQTSTMNLPVQARKSLFRAHPVGDYCFALDAPASLQ
jgi:hypothetical protein